MTNVVKKWKTILKLLQAHHTKLDKTNSRILAGICLMEENRKESEKKKSYTVWRNVGQN